MSLTNDVTDPGTCKHEKHMPYFNEEDAKKLSTEEIREKYPRYRGMCIDCKAQVILYASFAHYLYGDW